MDKEKITHKLPFVIFVVIDILLFIYLFQFLISSVYNIEVLNIAYELLNAIIQEENKFFWNYLNLIVTLIIIIILLIITTLLKEIEFPQ